MPGFYERKNNFNRIYISGPITGMPDYKERFAKITCVLRNKGYTVMSPAILPEGFEYSDYMQICMPMLTACKSIVMLDGWRDSKGALAELGYAQALGKVVYYGVENIPKLEVF